MVTERFLRVMAWEKAKGELNAMLQTFCGDNAAKGQYELMNDMVKKFISDVQDNGLQE